MKWKGRKGREGGNKQKRRREKSIKINASTEHSKLFEAVPVGEAKKDMVHQKHTHWSITTHTGL